MNKFTPPHPINEEVKWDKTKTIISKTDSTGKILYVNSIFEDVSEYNKLELIGQPHSVIRHPDMPKVVFKELWKSLKQGKNYHAIVKNLSRSGRYYWVLTDFTIERNDEGEITGYIGRRKAVPQGVVNKIEKLYKTLLDIENLKGLKAGEDYFKAYLQEEIKMDYASFVLDIFENEAPIQNEKKGNKKRKGLRAFFFRE